jgi:hypothetical protein
MRGAGAGRSARPEQEGADVQTCPLRPSDPYRGVPPAFTSVDFMSSVTMKPLVPFDS